MYINHCHRKLGGFIDPDSFKRFIKKVPLSVVHFIKCQCIGLKKSFENMFYQFTKSGLTCHEVFFCDSNFLDGLAFNIAPDITIRLYFNQQMKMVGEQTPAIGICKR